MVEVQTETAKPRYFAVGIGRWVEIRSATSPPKLSEAEVEREAEKRNGGDYIADNDSYRVRYVPRFKRGKYKLGMRCWIGGKVTATVSARKFTQLTRVSPSSGGMFELTEEMLTTLKLKKVLT